MAPKKGENPKVLDADNQRPFLIAESFEAPLSLSIRDAYNLLMKSFLYTSVSYKKRSVLNGPVEAKSAADVIAYQIGWGRLLLGWYEAGLRGEKPIMPGAGFDKWDYKGLARYFYATYRYENVQRQAQEFYQTVHDILAMVEKEWQNGRLETLGIWSWCDLPSGKKWPLSKWVQVNTVAPYKRAWQALTYSRREAKQVRSRRG